MTLVLLVAAGLLLQAFHQMRYTDLGMRPEHVLTLRTALPMERYEDPVRRRSFYARVLEKVERLPGVAAAGYTTSVPLAGIDRTFSYPCPSVCIRDCSDSV